MGFLPNLSDVSTAKSENEAKRRLRVQELGRKAAFDRLDISPEDELAFEAYAALLYSEQMPTVLIPILSPEVIAEWFALRDCAS